MESLANKYRPTTFKDCCGQEIVTTILSKQIELGNIKNTYLFYGPSGCGKTTIARIFAAEINKYTDSAGNQHSSKPIEIDAASNNGVDNIREIITNASTRSLDGKYKVIILDEVHMLTIQAWNALLKCLEEPPQYTIFILCTTEFQKIPETILSRAMCFSFDKISSDDIVKRLDYICKQEQFSEYSESIKIISNNCNNSLRNAISILEECAAYSKTFSVNTTNKILKTIPVKCYFDLTNALIDSNLNDINLIIQAIYQAGYNLSNILDNYLNFLYNIINFILYKDITATNFADTQIKDLEYLVNINDNLNFFKTIITKIMNFKFSCKQLMITKELLFSLFISLV